MLIFVWCFYYYYITSFTIFIPSLCDHCVDFCFILVHTHGCSVTILYTQYKFNYVNYLYPRCLPKDHQCGKLIPTMSVALWARRKNLQRRRRRLDGLRRGEGQTVKSSWSSILPKLRRAVIVPAVQKAAESHHDHPMADNVNFFCWRGSGFSEVQFSLVETKRRQWILTKTVATLLLQRCDKALEEFLSALCDAEESSLHRYASRASEEGIGKIKRVEQIPKDMCSVLPDC